MGNGEYYFWTKRGVWDLVGIHTERAVRWVTRKSIPYRLTELILSIKTTIFWQWGNHGTIRFNDFVLGVKRNYILSLSTFR